MKSITVIASFLIASSTALPAAMTLSVSGDEYTFTFDPQQSAPLGTGFASYTSQLVAGQFNLVAWTPANVIGNLPVVSNSLIDASGTPIPDSFVNAGLMNSPSGAVLGFGNTSGSGNDFTVAGGSLTLEYSPFNLGDGPFGPNLPSTPSSTLSFGSYDPGTTGANGNLNIPEPSSAYLLISGILMTGLARRRK